MRHGSQWALALLTIAFATGLSAQVHLTQSLNPFAVTQGLAPSCNNSGGTTGTAGGVADNSFWRAYDLATMLPNTPFRVEAFRVGFDLTGDAPNNFECKLYTVTGTFPTGALTQVGVTQSIIEPSAGAYTASIQIFPLTVPVNFAANTVIVMEFHVLNGQATAADFWPGAHAAGQSAPGYISSVPCGISVPTDIKTVGAFPDANLLLDLIGNGPEMDVQQPAATSIADGTAKDIGAVSTAGQSFTFTIANTGLANLDLPGTPVVVTSGSAAPNVSVTTQPAASVTFPTGTTTFVVLVQPVVNGAFDFTVVITSGTTPLVGLDFNENPYNFTVTGTGTGASNQPPVVSVPGGSGWTNAGGGLFTLTLQPGTAFANALEANDPEGDPMTTVVTNPGTAMTGLTGQPASVVAPTAGPITMNWTGTADASNPPGDFDWAITVTDGTTPTMITARITIVDMDPQHAAGSGTGGSGTAGTPYTRTFNFGDGPGVTGDICTVSDPNTSQTVTLVNIIRTGGTAPGGSGFNFALNGGIVTVNPAATLVANDVGTNLYTMDLDDGLGAPVTLFVTITVTPAPANSPPVVTVPGGSAWTAVSGILFTLTLQPGSTFNASLTVSDPTPDNMTVDVTNPAPAMTTITTQPVDNFTPTAGPITLTWAGTADGSNTPGNYDWTVDINDGTSSTIITARIIIVDTDPTHTAAAGITGNGSAGSPYLTQFVQGDGVTVIVNLANVSDLNTGQVLNLTGVNRTGGTAVGGSGFTFNLAGGSLTVRPTATLVANDVGTNIYTMTIDDGTGAPVPVNVTVTVLGMSGLISITNASPLPNGTVGTVYPTVTLAATGGTGPYTFTLINGTSLPLGLLLNGSNGQIAGTPAAVGVFSFQVRAIDSLNDTGTKTFQITIVAAGGGGLGGGGGGGGGGGCSNSGAGYGWLALVALLGVIGSVRLCARRA